MDQRPNSDWTRTPARAFAAVVVGAACAAMCFWSLAGGYGPRKMKPFEDETASQTVQDVAEDETARDAGSMNVAVTIELNAATRAELESLPGIGPALAERIIAEREANGPYASVDDLERVRGLGKRTIDRLRARVRVGK